MNSHLQDKNQARVVVMTAGGPNPAMVINALRRDWPDLVVIEEAPESKLDILRRRARKLGWIEATGQLATMVAARLLRKAAQKRTTEIAAQYGLSTSLPPEVPVLPVPSINSREALTHIAALSPHVVLLVSTRLLSRSALSAMPCSVINLHAGINPTYRGQMGGYWSLVEDDRRAFGATVHLVDPGTDTGETLYEVRTAPSKSDFISTYPMLLTAAAVESVRLAVEDAIAGRLQPLRPLGASRLRFPPAIWTWLWHGLSKGIW